MLRRGDDGSALDPIAAALTLAHAGLGLLKAKRTVEAAIERGEATAILPRVASTADLVATLTAAGFAPRIVTPDAAISVRALRERLGLTRRSYW